VAVFGCGGVGLSAIQGARQVAAHPIVAVDPVGVGRDLALRLGATHTIDPSVGDPVSALRALLPAGADFTFDAIGQPEVSAQAFAATTQGGVTVLIGQPAMGVTAGLPTYDVTQFEHTVLGSNMGGACPALDIPRLARLLALGKLDLASLVTQRYPLARINEAIALVESGQAGRVVLDLS